MEAIKAMQLRGILGETFSVDASKDLVTWNAHTNAVWSNHRIVWTIVKACRHVGGIKRLTLWDLETQAMMALEINDDGTHRVTRIPSDCRSWGDTLCGLCDACGA